MNLMGFMSMLGATGWNDPIFQQKEWKWVADLFKILGPILYAIMAVTAAAAMIYSIWLGINLAKAEDQSKRDDAKKRLITTIVAVVVVVVLVLFFNLALPAILGGFGINSSTGQQ